ncbi:hypothetical protein CL619_00845 [archaeon]|nr:hypothetical protein [archaeon]|tara:strand:- start:5872 stop:6861 length:990 start_codon:yes stop_codon:yes gene_type:complete
MVEGFYVGIDGGGTKTRAVISKENGQVLAEVVTGPSNPNYYGLEKAAANIVESILKALNKVGADYRAAKILGCCCGLSGAGPKNRPKMHAEITLQLKAKGIVCQRLKVVSDTFLSWYSAFAGEDGIIIISGTGGIVYGRVGSNDMSSYLNIEKARLLRGGGFHIGLYAAKVLKVNTDSILRKVVEENFNSGKLWGKFSHRLDLSMIIQDILRCFDHPEMNFLKRSDVAELAKYVDIAAESGSPWAKRILKASSRQISVNVQYVANKLRISGQQFSVAVFGSVIKSMIVKRHLRSKLFAIEPFAKIQDPRYPPEVGALMIAIGNLYHDIS